MRKKKIFYVILLTVLIGLFLFYPPVRRYCCSAEYRTFHSPDGNFKIVVYRISIFPSMAPGSSGDAPGYVRLYNKNDAVLGEASVDIVSRIESKSIYWEKNNVDIKLVVEWSLPAE